MFKRFENLVDPFTEPDGPPPDRFWPYLLDNLKPFRRVLSAVAVFSLSIALIETGLIFYAGRLVDLMAEAGATRFFAEHGIELLAVVLFIVIARPVAMVGSVGLLNHAMAVNITDQIRWRAHRHLLGQSIGFFNNEFAGRIANRVVQTGPAVEDSAYMFFEAIWYAGAYVLGAAFILSQSDPRLLLPVAIWLTAYLTLLFVLIPKIGEASRRMSDGRSLVTGRIVDAYTNIQTVKLFAHAGREERYARNALAIHRLRFARLMRKMTAMTAGLAVLNGLLIVSTVGMAVWLWQTGEATIGAAAAAAALTLRLNGMTGWIMWVTSQLFQYSGQIKEGMQTISEPHGVTDAPGATELRIKGGQITFRGVRHLYGRSAAPNREDGRGGAVTAGGLHGIDLEIQPGERVGLVGRSGAGKSTLINLLLRFYDAEAGRIEIDGQDIAKVTQASLRGQISVVTQDTALLHRSVRDNILYGNPDAGDEAMRRAAATVRADDFIAGLRDPQGREGYDAHVGERGVKLSGGQRQRIALARAIVKDAPILILDEATSALDSESEALIQSALADIMPGRTVIAIAHRLSTIQRMDRIVVLENGRIAEQGSHAELLEKGGLYAGFWDRQSGGFIGTDDQQDSAA